MVTEIILPVGLPEAVLASVPSVAEASGVGGEKVGLPAFLEGDESGEYKLPKGMKG